jgi:hypothetical protein
METLGIGTAAAALAYGVGFWLKHLMPGLYVESVQSQPHD